MKSFQEWYKDRTLIEMAKKPQPVEMPKADDNKMVIRAADINVSIGHQGPISGTGVHDPRPRRERTRAAQKRKAIADHS